MSDLFLWTVTAIGITAGVANIYRRWWCFALFAVTHGVQAWRNVAAGELPLAVVYAFYVGLSGWGMVAWLKESRRCGE